MFPDHAIRFDWELLSFVPRAATLTITDIRAKGLPKLRKQKQHKKGAAGADGGARPDPYLRFTLMEVGELVVDARTPAVASAGNKEVAYDGTTLTLSLPRGSHVEP